MKFRGVFTAIVTPMQQGNIDEGGLRTLVRRQIDAGIHGLVVNGSTGEAATLTDAELVYTAGLVVDEALGRVPVIAGVGSRSTHGAIAQARAAEQAGVDALLVVTPPYNKPTQAGLIRHFLSVAENTSLPICLYNVPGRTAVDLLPPAVAELAKHERIVAIKEATGSLVRATEIRRVVGDEFSLMSGDDFTTMPFLAQGGDGCISVLSNIAPEPLLKMLEAIEFRNYAAARRLHHKLLPLLHALFVESNPIPVKTAAAWLNIIPTAELRLPLEPLTERGMDALEAALTEVGLHPVREPGPASTLGPSQLDDLDARGAQTIELSGLATP
jgi:4-hydroxy-tetrahydrodipicolinate synthase